MTIGTLSKARLLGSGLLVMTFVAGALVGAAGERALKARERDQARQAARTERDSGRDRGPGGSPAGRSILLRPGVFDSIGATPEQRKTIQEILARREQGAKQIWADFGPRMEAMMDSTRGELRAQLTQEQRDKLDQIIKRRRQENEQNRNRGHEGKPRSDSAKKPEN